MFYQTCLRFVNTSRPSFTPVYFMPLCFNAPYQFTSLLNLWSHFHFNTVRLVYMHLFKGVSPPLREYHVLIYVHFFRNKARPQNKALVYFKLKLFTHPYQKNIIMP